MLQSEETNLHWLARAITLPLDDNETKCYYDKHAQEFFIMITGEPEMTNNGLSNKSDRTGYANNNVVEVPRLSTNERVAIQLGFIETVTDNKIAKELKLAVVSQETTTSFTLDSLLKSKRQYRILVDYWLAYKYTQLNYPINEFEDLYDVNFKTATIWEASNTTPSKNDDAGLTLKKAIINTSHWWNFKAKIAMY